MFRTRLGKRLVLAVSIIAALIVIRAALEPRRGPLNVVKIPEDERIQVKAALTASAVDRSALVAQLAGKRVLLIGEVHFQQEPQIWLQ